MPRIVRRLNLILAVLLAVLAPVSSACPPASATRPSEKLDQALLQAIEKNQTSKALSLLKQGANPIAKNENGMTALMAAASYNSKVSRTATPEDFVACVKALLANGADVNLKNTDGKTALMLAQEQGHADIASLLMPPAPQPPH